MPIHSTAVIDPLASVDSSAVIGPHVVIDGPVHIGPECRIDASAVLFGHTVVGARCRIHAHAVVGDLPQDRTFDGSVSYCRIGNECVIREGATIHRGTAPGSATVVGDRCLLMTNSHVGHNCVLGNDVTLVSGALLGGYVEVGARAIISGNSGVHQFVRIGELAMVSVLSSIVQDVPPFFMTDRNGAIVGVNRVGLVRANVSAEEREEIKSAYRMIYRSGNSWEVIIDSLAARVTTDAGRRLVEFMTDDSSRGVARKSLRRTRAA